MLRSLFRKALLDKSGAGEITFVLTHSDVLSEVELEQKVGEGKSRCELALWRNGHVRWECVERLQQSMVGNGAADPQELIKIEPSTIHDGSRLVVTAAAQAQAGGEQGIPLWASPASWTILKQLQNGERVTACGPIVNIDGYELVPVRPRGAVEVQYLAAVPPNQFGCFTVSAPDCMRLEGLDLHLPQTFSSIPDTQIPDLRKQMHLQVLKRRVAVVKPFVRELDAQLRIVVAHLSDPGTKEEDRRRRSKEIVDSACEDFKQKLRVVLDSWERSATCQLEGLLQKKIDSGALEATKSAKGTAREWSTHSIYHHATYKGMVTRECYWEHPTRGVLDWGEELAGPAYDRFTNDWRTAFGQEFPSQVKALQLQLKTMESIFHKGLAAELVKSKCRTQAEIETLQHGIDLGHVVERHCNELLQSVKDHSVDVSDSVQQQVEASLKGASRSCRASNYASQKSTITEAATTIRFEESAVGLKRGLTHAVEEVKLKKAALQGELVRLAHDGYQRLWRDFTKQERADWADLKRRLLPQALELLEPMQAMWASCENEEQSIQRELQELLPQEPSELSEPVGAGTGPAAGTPLQTWARFLRPRPPSPVPRRLQIMQGLIPSQVVVTPLAKRTFTQVAVKTGPQSSAPDQKRARRDT